MTLEIRQYELSLKVDGGLGVWPTSCLPISCGASDLRGAGVAFRVQPDGSGGLPVAGFAGPAFWFLGSGICVEDGAFGEGFAVLSGMAHVGGYERMAL